ncbi:MAG TPA: hypothetical protein DIS66_05455 [Candidatus Omnitrophica bacterium]|nr:hypothetical protein [Candidatus Omnitrophota bacterium]
MKPTTHTEVKFVTPQMTFFSVLLYYGMQNFPFELDPFQKEALSWIEQEHSLFVSAPTGAGKTVIADAAVRQAMDKGKKVIYTAPIKALSNQKFRDFKEVYGIDKVGILTGDVSINPDAPVVIMTTEIYRNCLFEASERVASVDWVIFDEVHYLDDAERGTVWEESLLFTPQEIKILALSATIPNVRELADWIKTIHGRDLQVIVEKHRPVPLKFLYQCQGKVYEDSKHLLREGYWNKDSWRVSSREKRRGIRPPRPQPNLLTPLIKELIDHKRLPAIYFCFGRKKTEQLAFETLTWNFLTKEERIQVERLFDELLFQFGIEKEASAESIRPLIVQGIAFHHAGMLPTLKEVVERLFTSRLIKFIFTTETFALGINMPAKAVIFDELEKFYGTGFDFLTTRDFFQMAGRAGRRGLDHEGFVYSRVQPDRIPYSQVMRVIFGDPERVRSQFNTTYATLLNLYRKSGRELLTIYPRTFHCYQSSRKKQDEGKQLLENKIDMLQAMGYLTPEGLTQKGEFASTIFGYELMLAEMHGAGQLANLNEHDLCVLLSGLIFEPRKNDFAKPLSVAHEELLKAANHHHRLIHKNEEKFDVFPYTKRPHFFLAEPVEKWTHGLSFDETLKRSTEDEGSFVRHLRMIIQLLREIQHAPHSPAALQATASKARKLIDRDVVDAEKQLRV